MDALFLHYWPWWICAPAFAVITVGIWVIERRLLGVSGSYVEALKLEPLDGKALRELDDAVLEDAMLRATLEEFGPEAVAAFEEEMAESGANDAAASRPPTMPRTAHIVFLVALAVGGLIGGLGTGALEIRTDLGPLHDALTGGGAVSLVVLLVGGLFVGFGTRMAGGCTSGHGLSGCSRLQPGSLVATASFFGTAVVVSFLLEAL